MNIDELANSPHYRLSKILNLLETMYGITIDFDGAVSGEELAQVYEEFGSVRAQIISEAHHNSYNQNPEYTKAVLIQEAIRIFLSEVAPKRRRRKKNSA
jgi:hypothetical protein